jgi:hypothetical protein
MRAMGVGVGFVVVLLIQGCQLGPFVPQNPQRCDSPADCPPGSDCTFPDIHSHAVCMPGDNPIDQPPDPMGRYRRDAGRD